MNSRRATRTIDRSNEPLPPLWKRRAPATQSRQESFDDSGLMQSGPSRAAASAGVLLLDSAREMAIVCSFLLEDEQVIAAIERAARRGVRVYLLVAAESRLLSEPPEDTSTGSDKWKRDVVASFKRTLRRLSGFTLIRAGDSFHAKVILVDPRTQPAGLIYTANLTSKALERNQELAVALSTGPVLDFMALLKWGFWELARQEILEPNAETLGAISPLGEVEHPTVQRVLCTTPHANTLRTALLAAIRSETKEIQISSFGWSAEHEVVRALVGRARAGVRVTVFARPRPGVMPALLELSQAGATVLGFEFLHAKALWTTDGNAIVMTANLEPHGMDDGFELGVELGERDRAALHAVFTEWSETAEWELLSKPTIGSSVGRVQVYEGERLVPTEITATATVDTGRHDVRSLEQLAQAEPQSPQGTLPRSRIVTLSSEFVAPLLPKGAQELFDRVATEDGETRRESYSPPAYEHGGRTLIAVREPGQLAAAVALRDRLKADAIVVDGASR